MTGKSTPDLQAKCFECVAQEELQDIGTRRRRSIRPNVDVKKRADEAELFGVCLSGGGIRSATFALGVLQGLKGKCLLHKADYLSTVSGGGYIGAWLQGVVQRTKSFDALDPKASPEHKSVGFLRKYSNYLAARPGLSIDSTVIPVIWMRNAGLNQAIIIAAAFAAILACHIPGYLLGLTRAYWPLVGYGWPLAAYICAFCFGFLAVKRASSNLRGIVTANAPGDSPARIVYLVVIPLVLTALTLVIGIVKSSGVNGWLLFIASFLLHGALQSAGGFRECYVKSHKDEDYLWFRKHWHCVWMSAVSAGLACGLVYAVSLLLVNWRTNSTQLHYRPV